MPELSDEARDLETAIAKLDERLLGLGVSVVGRRWLERAEFHLAARLERMLREGRPPLPDRRPDRTGARDEEARPSPAVAVDRDWIAREMQTAADALNAAAEALRAAARPSDARRAKEAAIGAASAADTCRRLVTAK